MITTARIFGRIFLETAVTAQASLDGRDPSRRRQNLLENLCGQFVGPGHRSDTRRRDFVGQPCCSGLAVRCWLWHRRHRRRWGPAPAAWDCCCACCAPLCARVPRQQLAAATALVALRRARGSHASSLRLLRSLLRSAVRAHTTPTACGCCRCCVPRPAGPGRHWNSNNDGLTSDVRPPNRRCSSISSGGAPTFRAQAGTRARSLPPFLWGERSAATSAIDRRGGPRLLDQPQPHGVRVRQVQPHRRAEGRHRLVQE